MNSTLAIRKAPIVIALMGPTASGKTELAITLARYLSLTVLSVDSRQLYKEMEIGTTKPSKEQSSIVKHKLLDLRYPYESINLQEFTRVANTAITKEHQRSSIAFLVGGSGLYLKALTNGISPPEVPPHLKLRIQLGLLGQTKCAQLLLTTDPSSANRLSLYDVIRIQRALEVIYTTGKPFSTQQGQSIPPWNLLQLGLDPKDLRQRIQKRSILMYQQGLIEETKRLVTRYGYDLPLLNTIGYKEVCRWLKGEINIRIALGITIHRTLQFAKRQRTWFYHQHEVLWLNKANPLQHALIAVKHVLG